MVTDSHLGSKEPGTEKLSRLPQLTQGEPGFEVTRADARVCTQPLCCLSGEDLI